MWFKRITHNLIYNLIPSISAFAITVISIMGFTWVPTAVGQTNNQILSYGKELGAVCAGAGVWYFITYLISSFIDIVKNSNHLLNLIDINELTNALIEDPNYSRFFSFNK